MKNLTAIFLILLFYSCGTVKSPYLNSGASDWMNNKVGSDRSPLHTLYLVGDAGEFDDVVSKQNYVLQAISSHLVNEDDRSSLVYLGDNIYPKGLPKKDDPTRVFSEEKLNIQLEAVQDFKGP